MKSKVWSLCLIAALSMLTAIASAQATDTSGIASVNVQPAMSLTLVTSPDWGKVTRPPSGTARFELDSSTGAVSLISGSAYAFNNGAAGEYSVTGAAGAPVAYSVSIGAFSGSGISVVTAYINGTSSSGSSTLDGSGNFTLKIGGLIDVASTATVAAQTATVTVTVDYQ